LQETVDNYKKYVDVSYRGNVNTTTITTVSGQTIMIQHDVTILRPYSRIHLVSGTKATARKFPLLARIALGHDDWLSEKEFGKFEQEYNPPIIKKMRDLVLKIGGHGGIDFLMD
jgi:hypothetical protein